MKPELQWNKIKEKLTTNQFLSSKTNNELLLAFLTAKINGGYGRIVYEKHICFKTAIKKAVNTRKIDNYFKKDFDTLTEENILKLRDDLNKDVITANDTKVNWKKLENKKIVPVFKVTSTERPLSYWTKQDYKKNFVELWHFIMEYYHQTKNKELEDITKFWKVIKPENFEDVKVEYLDPEEIHRLLECITNKNFKSLIQLSLMSGARPCEAEKIRYGRSYNLYKDSEGNWIIHLPKIKGTSYKKFPFKIDMYIDELKPYFDTLDLKEGELVFKISSPTFRRLMKHYTYKGLKKTYSPKILRKTARMIRTNAGYPHDWINKLMGHAPGSKVQGHYTNYNGIENDVIANDKLQENLNPSLKREHENMKQQLQALQEQNKHMAKILEALSNEDKIKELIEG